MARIINRKPEQKERVKFLLPKIPKIIHQIWIPNWKQTPKQVRDNRSRWCKLNPEWDYQFWDEDRINSLIVSYFNGPISDLWHSLSSEYVIKKADLARFLITYIHGGLYVDMDLMPLTPLEVDLQAPYRDMFVLPEGTDFDKNKRVSNGVFGCIPKLEFILDMLLKSIDRAHGPVLDFLGPRKIGPFLVEEFHRNKRIQFLPQDSFLSPNPPEGAITKNLEVRSWGDKDKAYWWMI